MNQAQTMPRTETMQLNVGPSHPSTHGVLRVLVELDGELILKADPDIGFLHRGIEKMCEYRTYHKCMPLMNRLDYLAGEVNNFGFCLAVEKLLGVEVPKRAQYIRVMLAELTRIASHLFWLGTHGHDLGAMTPLFYAFREREEIMDMCEMVSGARMFPAVLRIGGLAADLPEGFLPIVLKFAADLSGTLEGLRHPPHPEPDLERTHHRGGHHERRTRSWIGAGPVPWPGAPGSIGTCAGTTPIPATKSSTSSYRWAKTATPTTGTWCGCRRCCRAPASSSRPWKRFNRPSPANIKCDDPKVSLPPKERVYNEIDALIHHFLIIQDGIRPPEGEVYQCIEAPKGEMGFYIVSDGSNKPFRLKVRGPSFINLSACDKLSRGRLLSDMIALIGTMDIVLADVDR